MCRAGHFCRPAHAGWPGGSDAYDGDLQLQSWDDAIRESLKELVSLENTMIDHNEAELMETINTVEDDRIQPHNWDT